jgi:hypothetical protein
MRYWQILTGQPPIEIYIQHVLFRSSGVSTDSDQQPPLCGIADDGMTRTGSSQISMEKCRRRGLVQCRKHLFGA